MAVTRIASRYRRIFVHCLSLSAIYGALTETLKGVPYVYIYINTYIYIYIYTYIYIYIYYIYIYMDTSEVGGSEFAFRQASPDREIVSCCAGVRAVWLPSHILGQKPGLRAFPFPFWLAGLFLFPFVIGFPISLLH